MNNVLKLQVLQKQNMKAPDKVFLEFLSLVFFSLALRFLKEQSL